MHPNRWLGPLALLSGLLISGVSAYFSIYGLAKIFTDTMLAGVVVFGVLELGKLVSASWLFRNWKIAPGFLKTFMAMAVVIMMAITSLGIFGYLSKAYTDKTAPVAIHQLDQAGIESELGIERDRAARAKASLDRVNAEFAKKLERDKNAQSLAGLRQQQTLVSGIETEIKAANSAVVALEKKRAGKIAESSEVSSDLGPLTFIARTIFDDTKESVDRAVRYMIGLLVIVFDPLAIALLLAANFSFSQTGRVSANAEKQQSSVTVRQHNSVTDRPKRMDVTGPTPVTRRELENYFETGDVNEHDNRTADGSEVSNLRGEGNN